MTLLAAVLLVALALAPAVLALAPTWGFFGDHTALPECHSVFFHVPWPVEEYAIPDCGCSVTFSELRCRARGPALPIKISIKCHNFDSNYTAITAAELSRFSSFNFTLNDLELSGCALPSTFASLLARLGQAEASPARLYLTDQTRIPFDVFEVLPELEKFFLTNSTRLQLEESIDGDAPPHPALRWLALSACGITDVPPGAFARLGYITRLNLDGNLIKSFSSDTFRGLKNLETLDLLGNPIAALPSRAFELAPRLRMLRLDMTRLGAVPGDAFTGLRHLEVISFMFVNNTIEFGARALAALPALRELTLVSTALKPLPGDLLDGSVALQELTIEDCGLEAIPKGFFKTQQFLKKLVLSKNKIKMLDTDVFQHIEALDELNLDGNKIEMFPGNLFSGLRKLKSVSANNNSLEYIAATAFNSNPKDVLSLNHNRLTSKALSTLDLHHQLKELHLQGNNISRVISNWFYFNSLKKLDLSWNYVTELKEHHVLFNSFDLELDLRHNHITKVRMDLDGPETSEFVTRILLDDNPYKCDCELYSFIKALDGTNNDFVLALKLEPGLARCASPPALKEKLIRNLPLSSLTCSLSPPDCPANCTCNVRPATDSLELECEAEPMIYPNPKKHEQKTTQLRLKTIPSGKLPSHVVSLNLTGLLLTEPPSLNVLQNIHELDLSSNLLTHVPSELLNANLTLKLARNNFFCDCLHSDNVYSLQNAARVDDADDVTCKGGEYVMRIDAAKLCEVRRGAILGGILAALGLLVAVSAGFANRYSLEIKVFLFSRGWCRSWVQENDLADAQYDAFVSFSQDDARWVAEQLVPKLEGRPYNYKLCVHYRDWVVGDAIPAQIATSVEQSRRTIVVLTKNFLKSMWAPLEFRAANVHAKQERRARVLVVILEEIPDCEEMDAELRAYLTTNTYLKWGDPWFWEKLRYAMPHRRTKAV